MVTGVQDGQVEHADAPTSAGTAGELETAGTGTTGAGALGEPDAPACPGTGTTGLDGDGVAITGGLTKEVEDAPASMGLGVGLVTKGTGTTDGVL